MTTDTLDTFTRAYIVAALALSYHIPDSDKGQVTEESLDSNYTIEDLAPETLKSMIADCAKFQAEYSEPLKSAYNRDEWAEDSTGKEFKRDAYTQSDAGHDFWLTRCGHGAGFWDGDWAEPYATLLTEAAKSFGNVDLYIGDDGQIHA